MDVVEMVLGGRVNKGLVTLIQQAGGQAVGLCGKDSNIIRARQMVEKDIGFVGDITSVKKDLIVALVHPRGCLSSCRPGHWSSPECQCGHCCWRGDESPSRGSKGGNLTLLLLHVRLHSQWNHLASWLPITVQNSAATVEQLTPLRCR